MSDGPREAGGDLHVDERFRGALDCHVHLMPGRLMQAIRRSMTDREGWLFPHPHERAPMEAVLTEQGVDRYCALPYAHKSGIAAELNEWLLAEAADAPMCIPFATVHPEDPVESVVETAFAAGARGLKIHCPVQQASPTDPRLAPAFELAASHDRPVLFHAGTAPMFESSPHVGIEQFERFCETHPEVRVCAAHMGTYDHEAFLALLERHEQAYLDTSFAMSSSAPVTMDFDPETIDDTVFERFAGRIMYGSDYPNIPYPYVDERRTLLGRELSDPAATALFGGAAEAFLGLA
jgi:predicted TIM-barrel fold metal-dependent hydrolase